MVLSAASSRWTGTERGLQIRTGLRAIGDSPTRVGRGELQGPDAAGPVALEHGKLLPDRGNLSTAARV